MLEERAAVTLLKAPSRSLSPSAAANTSNSWAAMVIETDAAYHIATVDWVLRKISAMVTIKMPIISPVEAHKNGRYA